MVDTLDQAGVRSGLLNEFAKTKGLASFDDEEEEPLRQLENQHQLNVHVEHCNCTRPSHHLRGSREKYDQYFRELSSYLRKFEGAGEVVVKANQPEWSGVAAQPTTRATDMLAQSMKAKPKRPASAAATGGRTPLQPMALPAGVADQFGFLTPQQGRWPRVGSFEVNYTLLNVKSKASYGPFLLSSKLMTERWPNEAKLHGHLQEHLQLLLKQDAEIEGLLAPGRRGGHVADGPRELAKLAELAFEAEVGVGGTGGQVEGLDDVREVGDLILQPGGARGVLRGGIGLRQVRRVGGGQRRRRGRAVFGPASGVGEFQRLRGLGCVQG